MSWSIGFDENWQRDIGYGVPAYCDHPRCNEIIDRGLAHVCADQEPYGGDHGCGLYFCAKHQDFRRRCPKCARYDHHPDWIQHKLTDPSWERWRGENPRWVKEQSK
jgi:hypothetical protein